MAGKQLVYTVSHIPSLPSQARLSQSGLEPRNLWPTLTSGRSSSSSQPASQSSETCVVGLEGGKGSCLKKMTRGRVILCIHTQTKAP